MDNKGKEKIECSKWLFSIVEDTRISLRKILSLSSRISEIFDILNTLYLRVEEADKSLIDILRDKIDGIIRETSLGIASEYMWLKNNANLNLVKNFLEELESVVDKNVRLLKEVYGTEDVITEVMKDNLVPLEVEVIASSPKIEDLLLGGKLRIFDKRLKKQINAELVYLVV